MLVKSIETLPALADSAFVLYFSCPSEFAVRLSACPEAGAVVAGVFAEAALDVAGLAGVRGVEAEELVVLDELPQPLRASSPAASASIEAFDMGWLPARRPAVKLTIRSSSVGAVCT
jgi:hypothetical protein